MDLHHAHIFASDMERTLAWWRDHLGARVLFDGELAGARNVLIGVGSGRINIYDQAPKGSGRGPVHHLGVRVKDFDAVWERLGTAGVTSPGGPREYDGWRYVMIAAPDDILVEIFEFDDLDSPFNIDD
jgi:catechol 2,3-dioxygenase-like lactoylglutathione lyase family enzyme